jgi:hypothetical protein
MGKRRKEKERKLEKENTQEEIDEKEWRKRMGKSGIFDV